MASQILFNVRPYQTRIARLQNGRLKDIYYHQADRPSLVGAIYRGQVARFAKKLSFSFLDIGLKKSGFLYIKSTGKDSPPKKNFKVGQFLMVQIKSDSYREKGPRLTTDISLPGRYLVYKPLQEGKVSCSRKLASREERERLTKMVQSWKPAHSVIIRTFAENRKEDELKKDLKKLEEQWEKILASYEEMNSVGEIRKGLDPKLSYILDFLDDDTENVWVDDKKTYGSISKLVKTYSPDLVEKIKLFTKKVNLFQEFDVETQIDRAVQNKVSIKNGSFLIVEELEACSIIDVNSGRFMGKGDTEQAILSINLEAAKVCAEQIRLRQLAGIILIDFIDMEKPESNEKLKACLEKALAGDKGNPKVFPISELGIAQITRKRTRDSLSHFISKKCSNCSGRGYVKSYSRIAQEIFLKLESQTTKPGFFTKKQEVLIFLHPSIKTWITEQNSETLKFFEKELKTRITLLANEGKSEQEFEIKSTNAG